VKVAAVVTDLMLYSRIEAAARVSGAELARVDAPRDVPPDAELVLIDWTARVDAWADELRSLAGRRIITFGPHTDLEAHAAARAAGVGPMWARSKLAAALPSLFAPGPESAGSTEG
jgi:hypothetical protein